MGEYECSNCQEEFHLDEPPLGVPLCNECNEEFHNAST
jgi:DNA-directed RNA polymerase subunit RPC12/RpoP